MSVRIFRDFCEEHMALWHPQIPFAKRALLCVRSHLKIYPRMLCLKPIFSDHFFDKKLVFTKKVPSFTRCKNVCTKSIEITKNTHLRDAYVTQRVTRSIILVNLKLLILKSKHLLVLFTKLRATRFCTKVFTPGKRGYFFGKNTLFVKKVIRNFGLKT